MPKYFHWLENHAVQATARAGNKRSLEAFCRVETTATNLEVGPLKAKDGKRGETPSLGKKHLASPQSRSANQQGDTDIR